MYKSLISSFVFLISFSTLGSKFLMCCLCNSSRCCCNLSLSCLILLSNEVVAVIYPLTTALHASQSIGGETSPLSLFSKYMLISVFICSLSPFKILEFNLQSVVLALLLLLLCYVESQINRTIIREIYYSYPSALDPISVFTKNKEIINSRINRMR